MARHHRKDFGFYFWLHVIIIAAAFLSPILLPWWIIFILMCCYIAQNLIFGGCVITTAEFGVHGRSFWYHYLSMAVPGIHKKATIFFIDWILPPAVVGMAMFWQLYYDNIPLVWQGL